VQLAIDFDALKEELSNNLIEDKQERYQMTWPQKSKHKMLANTQIKATLRPCKEESVDFDNTQNLYIEGDNLDVLKLLRETYLGKVKMIYIDPPYNTGNDFIYNDDFAQSAEEYTGISGDYDEVGNRMVKNLDSNGRFHTDWLNMIYPRLKVARDLLKDDGLILINMDENEIVNLQKVCSEIFGDNNDLGTIVWDKRNPKGDARGISQQHEYIILYAKSKSDFLSKCNMVRPKANAEIMLQKAAELFKKRSASYTLEKINEEFQRWLLQQNGLSGGEKAYNRIDDNGDLYQAVSMAWPNKKKAPDDYFIPLIHPITKKACPVPPMGWRNPSKTMQDLLKKGLIIFGVDETSQPRRKYLLKENMYENIPSLLYNGGSDTDLLKELNIPFDTPKMVSICQGHISSFTDKNDIILDFFSGSATTAHAVMQLNAEDGGNRKFIMVQVPEPCDENSEAYKAGYKNICEIGKERIRRAGKKIKEENGLSAQNLDIGFRVLKLDSSNMQDVYYNPAQMQQSLLDRTIDNVKPDRTPFDLLFQVMLSLGVELSAKIEEKLVCGKTFYAVNGNDIIACFDDDINNEVITEIAKLQPLYAVFKDKSFASDSVAINNEQLFKTYSPSTEIKVI
jgi:adenine-specific DNA-methyltransferase